MQRNWVLKAGLGTVSIAIAGIGVFGLAHRAGVFTAPDISHLDPLWPFYAAGAVGCLAAQVVVACCGANFVRYGKGEGGAPKVILALGILVFSALASIGAENGWLVVTGEGARIASIERDAERAVLRNEINKLNEHIDAERAKLPDAASTPAARMNAAVAAFKAATADDSARLPAARAELESIPPLSSERKRTPMDWIMFTVFLAYQMLEPWLYYAAEQGRGGRPACKESLHAAPKKPQPILEPPPKLTEKLISPEPARPKVVSIKQPVRKRSNSATEESSDIGSLLNRLGV